MYEKTASSTTYKIPQCCCSCLGSAEKRLLIVYAREWTHDGVEYRKSYNIDVPICASCKRAVYKRRFAGVGSFLVVLALAWLVWQQDWGGWEMWAAIGLAIAGFITVTGIWFSGLPADIEDNGLPKFRNSRYQHMFEELNFISPSRYSHYECVENTADRMKPAPDAASRELQAAKYQPLFEFGSATTILRFPGGSELQYMNHARLLEHLVGSGEVPNATICGLKAGRNASTSRLILITGSTADLEELSKSYYSRRAVEFMESEHRGDWTSVNAASTLSNVAEPGLAPGDLGQFVELCQEIEFGAYELDKVIATTAKAI
jgi:hypothetical protein